MPSAAYGGRLAGALLLGFVTLVIAFVVFVFLLPYLMPLALGILILVVLFLVIWGVIYGAIIIGVAMYYFFKPTKTSRKDRGYSISKAREAGKRQKGKH